MLVRALEMGVTSYHGHARILIQLRRRRERTHESVGNASSSVGASLSVEEHDKTFLVSPNHIFSCGFYKGGKNAFYFSIWFTNTFDKTVIWTANSGVPVNGHGSKIYFNEDGNLVLYDVGGSTVWESKMTLGKAATVHLLESGNLVIKNSSNAVVWESFDSPTDTLLPLQPLTKNKKLISSYYRLYYDNDNVLRLMYDGPQVSSIYWPSPDSKMFDNGRTSYNSSRIAILDKKGRFTSSDGLNIVTSDFGPTSVWRRLTITQDGNLKIYSLNVSNGSWIITWQALILVCKVHGLCGNNGICEQSPNPQCYCPPGYEMVNPQNWTKGCQPMFNNINQAKEQVKFVRLHHTDFYGFDMGYNASNISFYDCKKYCSSASSCLGFSYKLNGKGECYTKSLLFNGHKGPFFRGSFYIKKRNNSNFSTISAAAAQQSHLICKNISEVVASGEPSHIVDPKLRGQFDHHQAMEMVGVSLSCMGERSQRPTMDSIVTVLMSCNEDDDQTIYA
ncbi:hypothetical protein PR202_gb05239 [Eleusine coracana subsp. coracana]|uniref:non-specific serine/threonine protein kinase n=1 Tax=Eleusine coracana subsp. coracana TaxID=191504 RepID=A0AAV5E677_ELECO|nr:hypothetical protein PR202_gb05239 [Eleusine coracana subsp. coracana]